MSGDAFTLAYANAAFRDLSAQHGGHSDAVIDRPLAEMFNPAAAQSLISLLERARREGAPVRARLPAHQTGTTGAWQCAAWTASDPADLPDRRHQSDPMVIEVYASSDADRDESRHRDLTELVLLSAIREEDRAAEADAARFRVEEARAAQDRFLADVSHDIRTPMQAIVLYARLMEKGACGAISEEQQEAITGIREGARHVIALIGELLQYATSAVRVEYALAKVEVISAVIAAETFVAMQARAKGIALEVAPGRTGAAVRADAGKLLQVMLNLLDNAVKFTAPGGTITISWDVVAAGSGGAERVAIRVADNGLGIASSELQRVFDPFVQVGESGRIRNKGVGLGLAISRDLAHAMNGELGVTSAPGVGSVFTLTLPAA